MVGWVVILDVFMHIGGVAQCHCAANQAELEDLNTDFGGEGEVMASLVAGRDGGVVLGRDGLGRTLNLRSCGGRVRKWYEKGFEIVDELREGGGGVCCAFVGWDIEIMADGRV